MSGIGLGGCDPSLPALVVCSIRELQPGNGRKERNLQARAVRHISVRQLGRSLHYRTGQYAQGMQGDAPSPLHPVANANGSPAHGMTTQVATNRQQRALGVACAQARRLAKVVVQVVGAGTPT
ncbi:unnamed protein product [Clonostachys byssicola]|uniref:Uncharacterized protein n=1 Tax=Clonostachys byssicola TaxID=160290 RepID=A0A9N9U9H7_9HYPO|nr:unnamed protein product [Clonostachys byssicola]